MVAPERDVAGTCLPLLEDSGADVGPIRAPDQADLVALVVIRRVDWAQKLAGMEEVDMRSVF